jgi:hypothetical protein
MTTTPLPPDLPRPATIRTALRLDHTRELLGLLPYQLGFHPKESVVAVSLRGPRREVGLVARVDLADLLSPSGAEIAEGVAGHLASDGAAEVVVVVYDDDPDPRDPGRGMRCDRTAPAVRAAEIARAACARVGDVAVWLVTDGHYLGLDCRDRGCCPSGGRPLGDLTGGDVARRFVARRGEVLPSRADVGAIRPAPAGPRRSASGARSRWTDALLRTTRPVDVLAWRRRSLDTWRAALGSVQEALGEADLRAGDAMVTAAALGRIEAALDDPAVRDAVVLTLVQPGSDVADALVRYADDGIAARRAAWDEGLLGGPDEPAVPGSPLEEAGDDALAESGSREDDQGGCEDHGGRDNRGGRGDHDGREDDLDARDGDHDAPAEGAGARAEGAGARADAACGSARAGDGGRGEPIGARAVSEAVRAALDVLVEPACAREPDDDVATAARTLLEQVVAHGRTERQAPALTLLALLAWWEGDGVRAAVLLERALSHDPGHRLAEVLDKALGAGLPPGWMRRRC